MNTRTVLTGVLGIVTFAWVWDALLIHPADGALPWLIRQNVLYVSGLFAISLMSLVMILATRPRWLESRLGGMDKIYRLHKFAGILAIIFGAVHWLSKLSSGPLKTWFGTLDRPAKEAVLAFMQPSRSLAKDLGEWAIYLLLAMLILTLWKRFPYRSWRLIHRTMPVFYLVLVFHVIALMPLAYWIGPSGVLQGVLLAAGAISSIIVLTGRIGRKQQHGGTICSVRQLGADVIEVICQMDNSWPGHRAGQFAFVTFEHKEGAHAFTIASADDGETKRLTFQIKALGDYTRTLAERLQCGQIIRIEGPYGRFFGGLECKGKSQVWVAGGIGITPFLAWLDEMHRNPENAPDVQLYYCVRNAQSNAFVDQLNEICAEIPSVSLRVYDTSKQERLDGNKLYEAWSDSKDNHTDIWYCGPAGLARKLIQELRQKGDRDMRIQREAFEMR